MLTPRTPLSLAARLGGTALALCLPLAAMAQWQWIDKDGRKVFSDRAPPADVPPKNIIKQPGGRAPMVVEAPVVAAASAPASAASAARPGAAASAPRLSGKDKELDEKKKLAEAAEAEKKKAEEEKQAKARAESCARAKQQKATYDSGVKVTRMNAKGEREVLDDKQRATESKRMDEIIAADCKTS